MAGAGQFHHDAIERKHIHAADAHGYTFARRHNANNISYRAATIMPPFAHALHISIPGKR